MKTIFKLFAILFILNIMNIGASILFILYKWLGFYSINNYFIEDLLLFSILSVFPLSAILLALLSEPFKHIKIFNKIIK